MTLIETLLRLPPTGAQCGFVSDDLYKALDKAVPSGYIHKDRSRAKYGETWWSLTEQGKRLVAQFRDAT
jgi:hypothetical protein